MEMQLAVNALVIETEIEQEQEFTQVEIKTPYSKVKIEFPVTELSMVEAMVTQKTGAVSKVEKLQAGTKNKGATFSQCARNHS